MRWNSTFLAAAEHELRTPPWSAVLTPQPGGDTDRHVNFDDQVTTDLARDVARRVLQRAVAGTATTTATTATSIHHVTAVPPAGSGRNIAAEIAAELPLPDTGHQAPVTMVDDRPGVINAIAAAAGCLASRFGYLEAALVTAGDASHIKHDPKESAAAKCDAGTQLAGGALVLSRTDGALRLVSTTAHNDPYLQHLRTEDGDPALIRDRAVEVVQGLIAKAVREASPAFDIKASNIACMIAPASSDGIESEAFVERLGGEPDAVMALPNDDRPDYYLGPADLIVRLGAVDDIHQHFKPGDSILLAAAGDGCSAAAALLQVV